MTSAPALAAASARRSESEQQVSRAQLNKQRREPGQCGVQRRRQGRLRVGAGQVVGGELAEHG
jgi:hypothetical protein